MSVGERRSIEEEAEASSSPQERSVVERAKMFVLVKAPRSFVLVMSSVKALHSFVLAKTPRSFARETWELCAVKRDRKSVV